MQETGRSKYRTWPEKFRDAFRGLREGVGGQSSFLAHFPIAVAVIAAAVALKISSLTEWCLLLACITVVLCAEMFNSALESLARAITEEVDPHVARALNIGSAAVLLAAMGAAAVGAVIFVNRVGILAGWW
jgi:diacylglycerol kinase